MVLDIIGLDEPAFCSSQPNALADRVWTDNGVLAGLPSARILLLYVGGVDGRSFSFVC